MRSLFFLSLNLIFAFGLAFSHKAKADDAKTISYASAGIGVGMIVVAGIDIASAISNCPSGTTPPHHACASWPLNTLTALGGVVSVLSSLMAANSISDGGGPNTPGFNPPGIGGGNGPFPDLNCAEPICDCTGPNAKFNPFCTSDPGAEFKNIVEKLKEGINTGLTPLPEGFGSKEDLFKELDSKLADAQTAIGVATGALPASALDEILGSGFGDTGNGLDAGSGAEGGFDDDTGGSGKAGIGSAGLGKGKSVGPDDRTGLGAVLWNGLLDMIDDKSGKSLSLWQRVTRRMQGFGGRRAVTLARIEQIRSSAQKYARRVEEQKSKSAKAPASTKKSKLKKTTPRAYR